MTVTESWDFIQNDRHGGSKYCRKWCFFTLRTKLCSNCSFCRFLFYLIRFSKKGEKSHDVISRYYSNRFSPKRVPAKKKHKQTKKKRSQNRLSFKAPHSLRSSESLLIIYRLWSFWGARSYSPCTCSSKKPKWPNLVATCLVHSFFHSYRTENFS